MKSIGLAIIFTCILALIACGDTANLEPSTTPGSTNSTIMQVATATAQVTSTARPSVTPTPEPASAPISLETRTPTPTAVPIPAATSTPTPSADSYYETALSNITEDDADNAVANLGKAIELNPNYVEAYMMRGLIYGSLHEFDKAIADFEKVVELEPDNEPAKEIRTAAYAARGAGYAEEEHYDKAIADFERAAELDPENAGLKGAAAGAYLLRGIESFEGGNNVGALSDLERAIVLIEGILELDSDSKEAWSVLGTAHLLRGIIHTQEGSYDMAIVDIERAIELEVDDEHLSEVAAYAYLQRAVSYVKEGDRELAIADFDRAVEIAPDDSRVRNARKFIDASLTPAELSAERIEWRLCEGILECGFVDVPADYRDPGAGGIRIGVNVRRADNQDERIGYLFVNPGGPGVSGLELVQDSDFVFADELMARFDIVGFDPRGVGDSEPEFACGAPGERIELLATVDGEIDTPEEIAVGEAAANLCIESMGDVGALLHSEYVARDMDEIRKQLGAEQISYLGFSYGSTLGVWYATLFPESVRAMVVDGADNPIDRADTEEERIEEYLEEYLVIEEQLKRALTACDSMECLIYNDGDPIGYYYRAAEKLHLVNEAAGGVPYAAYLAVIAPLYDEEDWPSLWQGLYELHEYDDPTILLDFAMWLVDDDLTAASFTLHVNCLDSFVLKPHLGRATRLDDSTTFDDIFEEKVPLQEAADFDSPSACPFYDQFAPDPLDVPLDGGGVPILVVGNHSDPATSFGESEELVTETLSNGYLLETSHSRHVVYPDNECVNEHVHSVLIDGEYPEKWVLCERED